MRARLQARGGLGSVAVGTTDAAAALRGRRVRAHPAHQVKVPCAG
jgi:hypothetical protein